jgi:alpha-mannosidase
MLVKSYRQLLGTFAPLSPEEDQRFSGVVNPALAAVRVIEDGEVRTVIEAALGYQDSRILLRYKLPKRGTEIEIEVRVHWNEKDRMLKLAFPTPDKHALYRGQVAYGVDDLPANGAEAVAQKWVAVVSNTHQSALTIINDGLYGSDFCYGEARLSLLRSPGYSTHPIGDRPFLPTDRYSPRIDQGERLFRFWLNAGPLDARLAAVDREALAHNEKPMALSFFPHPSADTALPPFATLSDDVLQLPALKRAEDGRGLIVRLFNPTGSRRSAVVCLPGSEQTVTLEAYEIRSYRVDSGHWVECNLVEEH